MKHIFKYLVQLHINFYPHSCSTVETARKMRMIYQVLQALNITLHLRDVGTAPWEVQHYLGLPENPTAAHALWVYVWDVHVFSEKSSVYSATVHTCCLALSLFTSPLFKNVVYQSIIDFQHCVNFYCTGKWLLYTGTHFFSYSFPLWFIIE